MANINSLDLTFRPIHSGSELDVVFCFALLFLLPLCSLGVVVVLAFSFTECVVCCLICLLVVCIVQVFVPSFSLGHIQGTFGKARHCKQIVYFVLACFSH